MSLDIQLDTVEPRRHTFANIARRKGADEPASRYEEAVLDVQASVNFHYRPTWAPEYELFDPSRTVIRMDDWYALLDPRRLYYSTWTRSRADWNANTANAFSMVEDRGLLEAVDEEWLATIQRVLLPLRHYEWGGNMNSWQIADEGYGTTITSAASFCAGDRLGMAQVLGRIGLAIDDATGTSLVEAKKVWMEDEAWQPLRKLVEQTLVVDDWMELFVAWHFVCDSLVHPIVFQDIDRAGLEKGGTAISMLTSLMTDWYADETRWVDAVLKVVAAASESNARQLGVWTKTWLDKAEEACKPLAAIALDDAEDVVAKRRDELLERARSLGIHLEA